MELQFRESPLVGWAVWKTGEVYKEMSQKDVRSSQVLSWRDAYSSGGNRSYTQLSSPLLHQLRWNWRAIDASHLLMGRRALSLPENCTCCDIEDGYREKFCSGEQNTSAEYLINFGNTGVKSICWSYVMHIVNNQVLRVQPLRRSVMLLWFTMLIVPGPSGRWQLFRS